MKSFKSNKIEKFISLYSIKQIVVDSFCLAAAFVYLFMGYWFFALLLLAGVFISGFADYKLRRSR